MKEMKKSSEFPTTNAPPPTSFSSLPYDVVLNCLARISRIHHPTLSLVSKSFRSFIASRELYATRSLIGKTEDCLYVCLDLNKKKSNPRWFTLAPIPKRQKLLPIHNSFPYQHPEFSTIVSMGSEMYLIGGLVNEKRSTRVLVLHCQSHQWRSLPDMMVPRERPAAEVIDSKIYVIGGCYKEHDNIEHWGEVYDPKNQTWEPLSPKTLDHLTTQKSVVPGSLVMGGKVYWMNGSKPTLVVRNMYGANICLAEIETNVWCEICMSGIELLWRDLNVDLAWRSVKGLEKLPLKPSLVYLVWVANSGGRRVTVWWKTEKSRGRGRHYAKECRTDIWCAEISFQRQGKRAYS